MRLYRLTKPGSLDNLVLTRADRPRPQAGQVVVRIIAAALNYRDLLIAKGGGRHPASLPDLVPLSDGAGEVVEVGAGVTRVAPGDRVIGVYRPKWLAGELTEAHQRSTLGGATHGVLAEYVLFDEDGLVKAPAHLSFEEAATLPCAALTAWSALTECRCLTPGQTVLVLGTGGVSIFALQFARIAGAEVFVTSSSEAKLARARALGATGEINYRSEPDWDRKVRALTGGPGVDRVVEVGGGTLAKSLTAVRLGGLVIIIGTVGGSVEVSIKPTLLRNATLHPVSVGSREAFEAMNRAIVAHRLRPVIDRVFPFEEVPAAYRYLESRQHVGKVVVRIAADGAAPT